MHSRKRDVTITVNGGTGQSGNVGATLGTPLSVNVKNYLGANYSGVQVEWLVNDDSFCTPSASLTDASGIASTDLTLGSAAGTVTVTARCGRQTVTITATKTATGAATITAASVTDQSGTTSAAVGAPPSVLVLDGQGNPVSGVSITWAVTAGGGSVNTTGATTTGATGLATLTSWTLGASAGLNTVTATSAGLSGSPVTFNANGVASAPTQIAVTSGGSQTGVTAGSAATATQFTVRDAGNNPVQGVTVSFSITTGSGSLSVASAVTNASGQASVTYTTHTTVETATIAGSFTNAGGTVVTASTTIASAAGAKTKLALQTQPSPNGSSGTALPIQPVVLIQDANSNTVLTATDTITAAVQSGNATIAGNTQAAGAGVATFTALTLTDADGGVNVLRFSTGALTTVDSTGTTLAPPIPAGLQFGTQPGAVIAGQPSLSCNVYVVDSGGGLVSGATNPVTLTVTGGGATLTGTTTVSAVAGIASFSGITVSTSGTFTLTATASGLTDATSTSFSVSAASSANPNEPAGMTVINDTQFVGFSQAPGNPTTTVRVDGVRRAVATGRGETVTDTVGAYSGQSVLRVTSPNGSAQGSGYENLVPANASNQLLYQWSGVSYTELTLHFAVRVDVGYRMPAGNGVQKLFHIWGYYDSGPSGQGGSLVVPSISGATDSTTGSCNLQLRFQNMSTVNGAAVSFNGSAVAISRGTWYDVEVYLKYNSAAAADGIATMWVDGVQRYTKTDLTYKNGGTKKWTYPQLNPTYGGSGTINGDQYVYFGFWYMSGK